MERCLYCGEPITLLQRWKLGRALGRFCSEIHQEAYGALQAQAVKRLIQRGVALEAENQPRTTLVGPEVAVCAQVALCRALDTQQPPIADDPLELAGAAMDVNPHDFDRRDDPALTLETLAPLTARPRASRRARILSLMYPEAVAITNPAIAFTGARRFDASYLDLQPVTKIPASNFGPLPVTFDTAPFVALPDSPPPCSLPEMISALSPEPAAVENLAMPQAPAPRRAHCLCIGEIAEPLHRAAVAPPPPPAGIEHKFFESRNPVRIPISARAVRCLSLSLASTKSLKTISPHADGVKPVISHPAAPATSVDLRLPDSAAMTGALELGNRRSLPFGPAGDAIALPQTETMEDLIGAAAPLVPTLHADPTSEVPSFIFTLGSPIAPHAADCYIQMPAELLALKREPSNQLPAFRAIPLPPLRASLNPIFFFEPIAPRRARSTQAASW